MKPFDLLRLIFGNLSRRKARVALTAIGVVIGTAAVVILVSLAIGLQRSANEQLYGIGDLTQIQVNPSYGGEMVMSPSGGGGGKGQAGGTIWAERAVAILPYSSTKKSRTRVIRGCFDVIIPKVFGCYGRQVSTRFRRAGKRFFFIKLFFLAHIPTFCLDK